MKNRHRLAVIGFVVLAAAGIAAWAEKGKLDHYELKVSTISPESMVLIKTFSTENTDLGSAKKVR